ncbi:MalY/PatB family protein [Falsihalocynthiibacter arcticus]|uniref:cysteine-S-conjugate beta-lyase n=1 Tax=Falsihalocynthiibacter arcticus TaxID=1579316 RepID=A0A126V5H6_9RHOB|nr:MalY/PatB family protein [Falsihalocynthiibacter arcticus]AML53591.1 aminotransferase [Falsihalocynthiibacter arcticus]
MKFDTIIDRRGTHSSKWDGMEKIYGVSSEDGLSMWVADTDFRPPKCVGDALQGMIDHGIFGYFSDDTDYRAAICWWMKNRHGWSFDPKAIFTTHGLVNAVGICLEAYTAPDDGVIIFTPVYHAFARIISASGRKVVECPLVDNNGRYEMDFAAYDAEMTGKETMLILCSPHNPGGRVWTREELQAVVAFAIRHDLTLVCDEIHHDVVFDGAKHTAMPLIEGVTDRLVMLTAPSKTFNIAGAYTGNAIIEDPDLHQKFAARMSALGLSPNSFGLVATTAAYSPEGAEWVDSLVAYIAENKRIFDEGINAIPGLKSMHLEATYLAWVDFAGTGMSMSEISERVAKVARIATNQGPTFGTGGEVHLRFNVGTQRSRVQEAVSRMQAAFGDLQ